LKPRRTAASTSRIVYSTGTGICRGCVRPLAACVCGRTGTSGRAAGRAVRVGRETQGRAGKGVTVITGLGLAPAELDSLARALKQRCGSGGTVRDGVIELQGEHRDAVVAELARRGIEARRSGG
jgi:translation initiation factor 1